jgi:hypothetical protein
VAADVGVPAAAAAVVGVPAAAAAAAVCEVVGAVAALAASIVSFATAVAVAVLFAVAAAASRDSVDVLNGPSIRVEPFDLSVNQVKVYRAPPGELRGFMKPFEEPVQFTDVA